MWVDAKKKQQMAACLALCLTKLAWRDKSSQSDTHSHSMTSTQGWWCHNSPYILFNKDQQYTHLPGNPTPVCTHTEENMQVPFLHAASSVLCTTEICWPYQGRHWPVFSSHRDKTGVTNLKMSSPGVFNPVHRSSSLRNAIYEQGRGARGHPSD